MNYEPEIIVKKSWFVSDNCTFIWKWFGIVVQFRDVQMTRKRKNIEPQNDQQSKWVKQDIKEENGDWDEQGQDQRLVKITVIWKAFLLQNWKSIVNFLQKFLYGV